jgi:peptidoglycan/xylan/chitin deacetylase (PgdA/CDA1 family)
VPRSTGRLALEILGRPLELVPRHGARAMVVVLIYHRVGGRTASAVDLPAATFERHLDDLAEAGVVVDLDTAATFLASRPAGDDRARVVVTFDDGTADWPDVVLPALLERRLPATFYVATDFVERGVAFPDEGRPVSWSGLGDMATSELVTIGSHTHTHRVLAAASAQEAAAEVDRSIGLVEDRLARPCRHFAYPKAVPPSAAAEVVVRRRFATAALAGNVANVRGRTDLHRIGRHPLAVDDDAATFRRKAEGGMRLEGLLRTRRDAWRC